MAVHFKFRSAAEFDRVEFGEPFISVRDLKRKIAEQKRLSNCQDFDLLITHAQTGEQYNDENALVPKDTTVIIKRVPAEITKAGVSLSQPLMNLVIWMLICVGILISKQLLMELQI
eukprot:TRINITY_DN3751_c0_g1_i1.p1 TRINITY_DN3751_c0_g1~~TRINITY_DN3751_c0_g1_i1.p1  ORF type:complete len:116 (-),score=13.46 TRINITY_DN3751_c0_g1_i1:308-655(-)